MTRKTITDMMRKSFATLTLAVLTVAGTAGWAEAAGTPNPATSTAGHSTKSVHRPAAVPDYCPTEGERVKGSSATVYLISPEGAFDIIPNETIYFNLWGSWDGIVTLSDSTIATCIADTAPASYLTDAYLQGDSTTGEIFIWDDTFMIGGFYRWIPDMTTFNEYKFDISKVLWDSGSPYPMSSYDWT